jgi:hypothetical protein
LTFPWIVIEPSNGPGNFEFVPFDQQKAEADRHATSKLIIFEQETSACFKVIVPCGDIPCGIQRLP